METNYKIAKYRGKDISTSEWVYGTLSYYFDNGTREFNYSRPIIKSDKNGFEFDVHIDTVGQFILLLDKKNNELYVGDIFIDNVGTYRTIRMSNGGFVFESNPISYGYGITTPLDSFSEPQNAGWIMSSCRVVGNIHDNNGLISIT